MTISLSDYRRIVLEIVIGGSNAGISRSNLELTSTWQAPYVLNLKGDFACSAQCK